MDGIEMGDLKWALDSCPNLISLRIESCLHLSNLLAGILADTVPFLFRLELPGCTLSDSFFPPLLASCHSIRHLDISHTSNVTLACLPLLVNACTLLESVDMTGVRTSGEAAVLACINAHSVGDSGFPQRTHLKRAAFSETGIIATGFLCCRLTLSRYDRYPADLLCSVCSNGNFKIHRSIFDLPIIDSYCLHLN